MSRQPKSKRAEIEAQYRQQLPLAVEFLDSMARELNALVKNKDIALASPIESRIKDLTSIHKKMEDGRVASLAALKDLIGLRIVVLFQRDLAIIHDALTEDFTVHEREDTGERLSDSQFGYKSVHYIVGIQGSWLEIPSWEKLGAQRCEIQVRTMAQHIWAAASHKLQYKNESSVPAPIRRAISRVSALLETVDLEFERVLVDREKYRAEPLEIDEPLNVENVRELLDDAFPEENRDIDEGYADLLTDLKYFNTETVRDLKALLNSDAVAFALLHEDNATMNPDLQADANPERAAKGVYFSHVGLARFCLEKEFGQDWTNYNRRDRSKPTPPRARRASPG